MLLCIKIDAALIKFGVGGVEHGGTSAFGRLLRELLWRARGL